MKQYRAVVLGNWHEYLSYFLMGTTQGLFLNNHLCRPIPLFGQGLNAIHAQCLEFKPDIIFCHMIFNRAPHDRGTVLGMLRSLRSTGIKVAYHAGDARGTPRFPENISNYVDFVLINHWPPLPTYKVWGVPCYHWPYAALNQDDLDFPSKLYECDLAFTGGLANNEHHAPRAAFVSQLKSKVKIQTFPTPATGNTRFQTATLSMSAKAVLGFQMGLDIPGYLDVRPFQYIGAGALYFHDRCEAMDNFFVDGKHYVAFERDNVEDFMKKYNHYVIEHPKEGAAIRLEGFAYCQEFHSSKTRVAAVIDLLETGKYKIKYLEKNK